MSPSRIRVPDLKEKKSRGEKIAMLTAYDATMARLLDQAGVDALLVGDSVAMVVLGYENTLSVTLDDMLHHSRAVARGATRALIVADMPFLSYQVSAEEAVRNAGRLLQEGGGGRRQDRRWTSGARGRPPDGRRRYSGDGTSRASAAIGSSARRLHQTSHSPARR